MIIQNLAFDFDELKQASSVERSDVAVDQGVIKIDAFAHLNVGAHDLFADIGYADEAHRNAAHLVGWRRRITRKRLCGNTQARRSENQNDKK